MEAEKLLHKIYSNGTERNENRLRANILKPGKRKVMVCDFMERTAFAGLRMRGSFVAHSY